MGQKVQGFNVFWKRVIILGVLVILAVPLVFFIFSNFQQRARSLKQTNVFVGLKVPDFKEEASSYWQEIGKEMEGLVPSTSTDISATTSSSSEETINEEATGSEESLEEISTSSELQ